MTNTLEMFLDSMFAKEHKNIGIGILQLFCDDNTNMQTKYVKNTCWMDEKC